MTRPRLSERQALAALIVLAVLLGIGKFRWPDLVPVSSLGLPIVVAGLRLSRRSVVVLTAVVAPLLVIDIVASPFGRTFFAALVVLLIAALAYRYAGLREQWGMSATQGMPILMNVRDRVRAQGEPPDLLDGWVMARALRSAQDAAFRGDFTLAHREGAVAQAMVVDVSGHGLGVASRATQVAGAFGGLIAVISPAEVLRACNDYLVRQQWDRDYATAVHVVVDQSSGAAHVRSAGHPPARLRRADGGWTETDATGPVLGLGPGAEFGPVLVELHPGDVLVMVTDGALDEHADTPWGPVERTVEGWLAAGAPGGTLDLPELGNGTRDDQTVMAVHRRPASGRD